MTTHASTGAIFSVVATPIGNLEDVTLRALDVLRHADLILCEDTRVTRRLLDRHGISSPTLSYHAHSKIQRVEHIIGLLKEGKHIALVSDAGTPGISDPGSTLVAHIRSVLPSMEAVKIEAIPGPSALTAALSIAGVSCADFTFLGFLPHKKGRETLFKEIASAERTMVFYESPHRILKALDSLERAFDKKPKRVSICRELTKIFEEVVAGPPEEVKAYFDSHPDKVKGEFVVIVSAARK